VLLDAAGAVRVDGDFRQVAVVVRIGLGFVAVQALAEALELGIAGSQ
jgi:hypothetical protein